MTALYLAHVVDDAHHDLVGVLIEAHEDGVVHHGDDGQEERVVANSFREVCLFKCASVSICVR